MQFMAVKKSRINLVLWFIHISKQSINSSLKECKGLHYACERGTILSIEGTRKGNNCVKNCLQSKLIAIRWNFSFSVFFSLSSFCNTICTCMVMQIKLVVVVVWKMVYKKRQRIGPRGGAFPFETFFSNPRVQLKNCDLTLLNSNFFLFLQRNNVVLSSN